MTYYIDPGTGSMLFTILIGVISAAVYGAKNLFIKLRFSLSGGKVKDTKTNNTPLVLFSEGRRYATVFEPICAELEKRQIPAVYMTADPNDPILTDKEYKTLKTQFIGEGNRAFAKLNMLKADIVLATTPGLDVYQWKRSRDVKYYVHIFHACSDVTLYKMFGIDYYDALLLSGDYQIDQIRKLEALRNLPAKDLQIVGQPYMDVLLERKLKETKEGGSNKTVLIAPSWGESSVLKKYDGIIDKIKETGYDVIVRPHPQSYVSELDFITKLQDKYPDIEFNRDADNFDVLSKNDILISDFSGVMFDFALVFDKPVIYTAPENFDSAPYDAYWLDEPLWVHKSLPLLGKELNNDNFSDIKQLIDDCLTDQSFATYRDRARNETWQNIGHSSELIVDYLENKLKEINEQD